MQSGSSIAFPKILWTVYLQMKRGLAFGLHMPIFDVLMSLAVQFMCWILDFRTVTKSLSGTVVPVLE
eukprot:scaffold22546_cov23-Cyclotella_meneghiniana.AAC.1